MTKFVNILTKSDQSDIFWVTRYIRFVKAYSSLQHPSVDHKEIKEIILNSDVLKAIEELESGASSDDKKRFNSRIREILDEVGYKRSIATIRWLAYLVVKILRKTLDGIYVNETALMKLKETMGSSPVVLVPTHRSYGDFILMAFICFVYEIEIPCVAAGLDFLSMWVMGEILRKTKAFFIRRTFQDDKIYKRIFAQYVSTLVSQGDSPLEFFIEGTRSRTGKSLKPKYGFLSMILKPYLDGEVPDIQLVPVSVSYDRFLEEWLFTRELLGIPKPKESTKGLFKVLSILKENYGNVYFNFGEPISVRDWITRETGTRPVQPSSLDVKLLAAHIIQSHTELQVLGAFHLVMVVLYNNLVTFDKSEMPLDLVTKKFSFVLSVVHALGVNVLLTKGEPCEEVMYACTINPALIGLKGNQLQFFAREEADTLEPPRTLSVNRGIMLLLYVNPVASVLFCPALLMMVVAACDADDHSSDLVKSYDFLCEVFEFEFPLACCERQHNYQKSKSFLLNMNCIASLDPRENSYSLSANLELIHLLYSIVIPYIEGYYVICRYLLMDRSDFNTLSDLSQKCEQHLKKLYDDGTMVFPLCVTKAFAAGSISTFAKMNCILKYKGGSDRVVIDRKGISELAKALSAVNFNPTAHSPFKTKL